jgi:hypothetical protein
MQAIVNWGFCVVTCVAVSVLTRPPHTHQVTDQLVCHWHRLSIFEGLGTHWYNHVVLWWSLFALGVIALCLLFSGIWL